MKSFVFLFLFFFQFISVQSQNGIDYINKLSDSLKAEIFALNFDKAKRTINEIDSIIGMTENDTVKGIGFNLKGNYYYRISNYEKAMQFWLEANKYFEKINDSLGVSWASNNISLIFNSNGKFEKSLKIKKRALLFCPSSLNEDWNTSLLLNISSTYRDLKKYDSSFFYLEKSYKILKKTNSKRLLGLYYHNNSINHLQIENYNEALKFADTLQTIYKNYASRPMLENSIYYSAKSLNKLGKYMEALAKAELSLKMVQESGMTINIADSYELISNIHENLGNNKQSLKNLKRANIYRDSIFGIEKNKAVLELEKKYETEKKEKENLKLKQETVKKDLSIATKNNIILISSLSFGLIILLLITYQLIKFRAKNKTLKNSIEERVKIEKELEIVRDNIAKDFHDDLGNKLARIATLSDLMISTSANRDKEHIISVLKSIKKDSDILYKGTRDFMFSLKANSDYIEELFTYLSDFGEEFFESFNIDFFVEKKIQENIKLPYYWTRQIIMIFKEAITNVVKHSGASMVTLSIEQDKSKLCVTLTDNGSGFKLNDLKRKNGLINMKTRAEKIDAFLKINTSTNGTVISFTSQLSNL